MKNKSNRFPPALKIFLWVFLAICIVVFAALATTPTFLSSDSGKKWTLDHVNRYISGHLEIQDLSLSWLGGQDIKGFSLKQANGEEVLSFEHFSTNGSLFSFLFGSLFNTYDLGTTSLEQPYARLIENSEGEFTIKEALSSKSRKKTSVKKNHKHRDFPELKGEFTVKNGEIFLASPKIEPIHISDLNVELKENPDIFHITAKTKQGAIEGGVLASGTFHEQILLLLNIEQFPVAILDQWYETSLYSEGLGKTLSLDVELRKTNREILLSSILQSANLKGSFKGSTKQGRFVMDPGGKATWTVTPAFFKQAIETSAAEKWRLAAKTDLLLTIKQLEFPLTMKKLEWNEILFSGTTSVERAEIVHNDLGHFSINNFAADFKTSDTLQMTYLGQIQGGAGSTPIEGEIGMDSSKKVSFGAIWKSFPVDLLQLAADETVYLKALVGSTFDFTTLGTYDKGFLDATVTLSSSQANLQGTVKSSNKDDIDIDLTGELTYSPKYSAVLGPSPKVTVHADASLLNNTFSLPLLNISLENPYWTFDLRGKASEKGEIFSFDQLQLVGVGTINDLPIENKDIIINDGSIFIQIDGATNEILSNIELTSSFRNQKDKRSVEASATIRDFIRDGKLDFKNAYVLSKGDLNSLPVALLNPFVNEKVNLTTLFGHTLDLQYTATYTPSAATKATLDLHANGQDFHGNLSIALDGTLTVSQNKPAFLHWELTPARYQTLMRLIRPDQEPAYVLTRGAGVDLTINQFMCPTDTSKTLMGFICQSGFIGELKVGPLHFKSRKGTGEMALLDINSAIEGENFSKAIRFNGKGRIVSTTIPTNEQAGFYINGELIGFWTPEGLFNKQGTVKGELSLDLLPVREFTGIFPFDDASRQKAQALLGSLVNARIYGEISDLTGPMTVDIKSSNLKALFPVMLHGNYLTLQKNVEAELTLTEAVNEIFLKDAIPILITGAWSEHPVRVFLDAEGFALPFQPFSLQGTQIQNGVIDLGKLRVHNGGNIQALVDFLKAKEITNEGIMEAWFTPIYFSLKDGVASYKRFDALLAGNVHIAMWGSIDIVRDRVRMTLGISPATIQQRFNIDISKQDMFQVKMRGSTSNVELDWSAASTRIGFLIARSAGGGLGNIVGGLLEAIIGHVSEEPTPPPTTSPFPWEQGYSPGNGSRRYTRNRYLQFRNP